MVTPLTPLTHLTHQVSLSKTKEKHSEPMQKCRQYAALWSPGGCETLWFKMLPRGQLNISAETDVHEHSTVSKISSLPSSGFIWNIKMTCFACKVNFKPQVFPSDKQKNTALFWTLWTYANIHTLLMCFWSMFIFANYNIFASDQSNE